MILSSLSPFASRLSVLSAFPSILFPDPSKGLKGFFESIITSGFLKSSSTVGDFLACNVKDSRSEMVLEESENSTAHTLEPHPEAGIPIEERSCELKEAFTASRAQMERESRPTSGS